MEKYKVISWRDYHGIETVFRVMDVSANECKGESSQGDQL